MLLDAEGLTRRHQLVDVSLSVRAGEVVGLAGLLGSGRSETVKAIFGTQRLDRGTVRVGGRRVRTGSPRSSLAAGTALLPEDRKAEGIIPTMSVRDNIVLMALPRVSRWGFIVRRRVDRVVTELIARLGIKTAGARQNISHLSGGNQQKALIARMLCVEPQVLLLDEPTRGIDIGAKAEVQSIIQQLADQGRGNRAHLVGTRGRRRGLDAGASCSTAGPWSANSIATRSMSTTIMELMGSAPETARRPTRDGGHRRSPGTGDRRSACGRTVSTPRSVSSSRSTCCSPRTSPR